MLKYQKQKHERAIAFKFIKLVEEYSPELGGKMRSATEELRLMGRIEKEIEVVENMLKEGCGWDFINKVANVTQEKFNELKKSLTPLGVQLET